jgi:hypothetical protein
VSGGPKVREVYASYSIGGMLGVKGQVYLHSYLTLFPKKNMLCNIDDIKKFLFQGSVFRETCGYNFTSNALRIVFLFLLPVSV